MFIKIINDKPQKYTFTQLREDNPNTVFPDEQNPTDLVDFGVFLFEETSQPQHDKLTQKVIEVEPELVDGVYVQKWQVVELTEQEKSDIVERLGKEIEEKRRLAYQKYADPIYFQWQRGTKTEQDYLNMIEAVKQKYPYPEGYTSN
jgi:hypothetical protein